MNRQQYIVSLYSLPVWMKFIFPLIASVWASGVNMYMYMYMLRNSSGRSIEIIYLSKGSDTTTPKYRFA